MRPTGVRAWSDKARTSSLAFPRQDDLGRLNENHQIQKHNVVLDVVHIVFEPVPCRLPARAIRVADLRPPSDAGTRTMAQLAEMSRPGDSSRGGPVLSRPARTRCAPLRKPLGPWLDPYALARPETPRSGPGRRPTDITEGCPPNRIARPYPTLTASESTAAAKQTRIKTYTGFRSKRGHYRRTDQKIP